MSISDSDAASGRNIPVVAPENQQKPSEDDDGHSFALDVTANSADGAADKEVKVEYTKDGTTDIRGRPAVVSTIGGRKTLPFILGCQLLGRLGFYGITTNLVLYFIAMLHKDNSRAATDVNSWFSVSSLCSLLGAILADTYVGRYWMTATALLIQVIASVLLVLTELLPALQAEKCVNGPTNCSTIPLARKATIYLSLYIYAIGAGAFLPCVMSFGADQYDEHHQTEKQQKSRFFNLSYVAISCGGLVGKTVLVYIEQNMSYRLGFAISAGFIGLSLLVYMAGTPIYRLRKPQGNSIARILQVWVAAARKRNVQLSATGNQELYEVPLAAERDKGCSSRLLHTPQFRFLDKAAIISDACMEAPLDYKMTPWKLCTITQVEEAKFLLRIAPIWLSTMFYGTLYSQTMNLFVEQAASMNYHLGSFTIPPASISVFQILSIFFCTIAYENCIVPFARRFTGLPRGITVLQRMGIGLVLITIAMQIAAIVEICQLKISKQTKPNSAMSIFWVAPQYAMVGASEIFTYGGQFEFLYDQAPPGIRGIATSLPFIGAALGSYLCSLLIIGVNTLTHRGNQAGWISKDLNDGHLDYFFWLMAFLGAINFMWYLVASQRFIYKKQVFT